METNAETKAPAAAQERDERLYALLSSLGISYEEAEHRPVYTIEESAALDKHLEGVTCKNLFLRDKKKRRYILLTARAERELDLKAIAKEHGLPRLSFASEDELREILGLLRGSVTPMGLLNDKAGKVTFLLDRTLKGERLVVHPNTNTRSLSLECSDLLRLTAAAGHECELF